MYYNGLNTIIDKIYSKIKKKRHVKIKIKETQVINKGVDIKFRNKNYAPLHVVCQMPNSITLVKKLLAKGADVNAKDSNGYTPLFHSIKTGNDKVSKLLIEKGAKICIKSRYGFTVLHHSCIFGDIEITKLLIDKGADVNVISMNNLTPLHFACDKAKDEKTITLLINKGAKVEEYLPELIKSCNPIAIRTLHKLKPELFLKAYNGKSVKEIVKENSNQAVVDYVNSL